MIRTQIQLTDEQLQRLDRIAQEEDCSRAELIRRAIDQQLRDSTSLTEEESWDRAREVVGQYRSGDEDVSTHHDREFAEASGS